jgi:hypothetical protein
MIFCHRRIHFTPVLQRDSFVNQVIGGFPLLTEKETAEKGKKYHQDELPDLMKGEKITIQNEPFDVKRKLIRSIGSPNVNFLMDAEKLKNA